MTVRQAAMAGQFYPRSKSDVEEGILKALEAEKEQIDFSLADRKLLGGVSPHAGHIFCLRQAVHLFALLEKQKADWDRIILLNPNHTGWGAPLSLDTHDAWESPLGTVPLDRDSIDFLVGPRGDGLIRRETLAQKKEHSAEVLLPLLSYFLKDFKLIPLCMGTRSYDAARFLAGEFYRLKEETDIDSFILASSDFTHFQSPDKGKALDDYALDAILALDTEEFLRRVEEKDISICGAGPISVLLEYAKLVTPSPRVRLLRRGHSGEADYFKGIPQREVVDYVSLLVFSD